jgi:hypothetical protein
VKIEFDFDIKDWMEFQKSCLRNSKQVKKIKITTTLMLPALFLVLTIIDLMSGRLKPMEPWVFGIASLLWILFFPSIINRRILKKTEKMITEGDNSGILGKHELDFEENWIIHKTSESEQKIRWSGIKKLEETNNYYFLYDTAISAIIIPKQKLNIDKDKLDKLIKKLLLGRDAPAKSE